MALLNPPELRPSVQLLLIDALASRRGQREKEDRLIAMTAPHNPLDVRVNIQACVDLLLMRRIGDEVLLEPSTTAAARQGVQEVLDLLRQQVLSPSQNKAPWGSQSGARDLTNGLSWFLSFEAGAGPLRMEGDVRSAKELQESDFGPRLTITDDDDPSGWPIRNPTRWGPFRRWACSLGFAWVTPKGDMVADPTAAVTRVLKTVMGPDRELPAEDFVSRLAGELPVLDRGVYRSFVENNWRRAAGADRLAEPLSDALERLRQRNILLFDDRSDAPRLSRADGSTFSHVRLPSK
jgi:hypothetical protein